MRSQEDTILQALKNATEGLHPTYLIQDLHVYQYNRAIHNLRTRFSCTHKNNNTICFASEHIINKKLKNGTTIFLYKKDTTDKNEEHKAWVEKKREEKKQVSQFQEGLF